MSEIQLSEKLLAGLAGWDVLKQARTIVAEDRVLSSNWEPPLLRGVVQSGSTSYRAGLAIRRENDAENLCTCRQSREWGTLCAHSVAVGLHALRPPAPAPSAPPATGSQPAPTPGSTPTRPRTPSASPSRPPRRIQRAAEPASGEPLEIDVILPPTLAANAGQGGVTVFFEGRWSGRRTPLANLPLDQAFHLQPEDIRLLDAAERLASGDTPALLRLAPTDLASLFEALANHPRVTFGKSQRATITLDPLRIPLRATLRPAGDILLELKPIPQPPAVVVGSRLWIVAGTEIRPLGLPPGCLAVLSGPLVFQRPRVPAFLTTTLPALAASAILDADFTVADFKLAPARPEFVLHLAGGLSQLTAHLQCRYGARILTPGAGSPDSDAWIPDPQDPRAYTTRDPAAERAGLLRLTRHGFTGPDAQGRWNLNGQNQVLTFFALEYSKLEREWQVTLDERLDRSTRQNLDRIEPRFAVTPSGERWFDLEIAYSTRSGERLPATEIQRLLRGGQNFTRLKNGRFAVIDTGAVEELEEILVDCAPEQHAGGYRIDQSQAGFLQATLQQHGWEPVAPAAWRDRALQQTGAVALECPPLGSLDAVLRPYQKQGVAWLAFLRANGFGGILADEMGLGKTLQALALLASTRKRQPASQTKAVPPSAAPLPHLVICPTSLVYNWVAEAGRFTPQLRVLALHGPDRQRRFAEIGTSDLVVTSYALIRRDFERYRGIEFDSVILDEAQHIKNRQTQNAQAVKAVRSRHRLVLTGTPIENSVLDLWSIFDFLMPGHLGSAQDFRERYETPIVREKDAAVQSRLARRIRPFVLRRLKRDVAPELPSRIDQIVWCDLTGEQAAVYAQLLDATRREVTEAVGAQGIARSRMLVLTALLRLRQVCCDLRLLGVQEKPDAPAESLSCKTEAFSELLEEVIDGGHRVLVFSQFTQMLAILKERLEAEDIPFAYLDGSTRDRAAAVAEFQESQDVPVFLVSLKAGGVGLNLTAADTVIHFDPWWNPAVEDQATDRAHRIGQTRVVTSYKLIARGTVEEKILALQRRKRDVSGGLLSDEEHLAEGLAWEEIQDLLA